MYWLIYSIYHACQICQCYLVLGLFQATQYETHGQENTYVDGGVLCNYPIHCYDGKSLLYCLIHGVQHMGFRQFQQKRIKPNLQNIHGPLTYFFSSPETKAHKVSL